jgi:hypothetical protein
VGSSALAQVQLGKHALVKDAYDQDVAIVLSSEEHHVFAHFDSAVLWFRTMDSAQRGVLGETLAATLQHVQVSNQLLGAPFLERVRGDFVEVELRAAGVLNLRHASALT